MSSCCTIGYAIFISLFKWDALAGPPLFAASQRSAGALAIASRLETAAAARIGGPTIWPGNVRVNAGFPFVRIPAR
jgi:hypothetical protein